MTGIRAQAAVALAIVSVVSIGILAAVLLGPLDSRLRDDERAGLEQAARSARTSLRAVDAETPAGLHRRLREIARSVRRTSGGEVTIFDAGGAVLATTDPDAAGAVGGQANVQLPVRIEGRPATVLVRKPLTESRNAAGVVRRAFLVGALISLFLALLLGLLLARGFSRRLRALRDTALRVAEIGPVAEMRVDATRDEVGDLNRAFVSMQQRLREQEQARRAFVATASHELRTPLSSLQIMLDMLRADLEAEPPDVTDARDQARRADRQAQRLSGLAGELLDLSRIDAGVALRVEPVEIGESARSALAELEVRAAEAGAELRAELPSELWAVADPGAVAQILRILVDNALHHGGGTPVEVTASTTGDQVRVAVADAGPGVAPEDRDRIFERFERGRDAAGAGFGLGLAIARELARKMDGDLELEDAPRGARLVLSLRAGGPRSTAAPAPA